MRFGVYAPTSQICMQCLDPKSQRHSLQQLLLPQDASCQLEIQRHPNKRLASAKAGKLQTTVAVEHRWKAADCCSIGCVHLTGLPLGHFPCFWLAGSLAGYAGHHCRGAESYKGLGFRECLEVEDKLCEDMSSDSLRLRFGVRGGARETQN